MEQEVYEMQKLMAAETCYDCPECGASFRNDPETVTCEGCGLVLCAECERFRCEGCGEWICEHCRKEVAELDYCPGCEAEGRRYALGLAVEDYAYSKTEVIHA